MRRPYLSRPQSDALWQRVSDDGITIADLARETGRDVSALYRLFNRRYGFKAGHAQAVAWSQTITMPTNPADVGYMAGIIDGEGSIVHRSDGYWQIKVAMTSQGVMEWLSSHGGKLNYTPHPNGGRLPIWTWNVSRRRDIVVLLTAIRPYMRVKGEKADAALAALS